ncbi:MAG: methylenetetrahydrofolate reductase C-terminal domain-containing protein [Desulfitobacteriaceae bacterium]
MNWPVSQACLNCEECVLSKTDGLCPIRLCAKSLVSGPCGGVRNGKCEVNHLSSCVWNAIYMRMEKMNTSESWPQFYKDYARPALLRQKGMAHVLC